MVVRSGRLPFQERAELQLAGRVLCRNRTVMAEAPTGVCVASRTARRPQPWRARTSRTHESACRTRWRRCPRPPRRLPRKRPRPAAAAAWARGRAPIRARLQARPATAGAAAGRAMGGAAAPRRAPRQGARPPGRRQAGRGRRWLWGRAGCGCGSWAAPRCQSACWRAGAESASSWRAGTASWHGRMTERFRQCAAVKGARGRAGSVIWSAGVQPRPALAVDAHLELGGDRQASGCRPLVD